MEFKTKNKQAIAQEDPEECWASKDGWTYFWSPELPEKRFHRTVYIEECSNCGDRPDEEVLICEKCLQNPAIWRWTLLGERWRWNSKR